MTQASYCNILVGLDTYDPTKQNADTLSQVTKQAMYLDGIQDYMDLQDILRSSNNIVDELDQSGRAPLHWIVGMNNELGCEHLVREANLNVQSEKEGFTPLMLACRKGGNAKIAYCLLKHGANHRLRAKSSATAFHIAVASSNRNCMRLLVLYGANPFASLDDQRTAIDLVTNQRMRSLVYSCCRSAVLYQERHEKCCAFCFEKTKKLHRCGNCYITFYCSRNCQIGHWTKEHFEKCPGGISVAVTNFQCRSASNKINADKAFLIKVASVLENIVTFENEQKTLKAELNYDIYKKTAVLPSDPKLPSYYWARFADSSKQELIIYLGSLLPVFTGLPTKD